MQRQEGKKTMSLLETRLFQRVYDIEGEEAGMIKRLRYEHVCVLFPRNLYFNVKAMERH